MGIFKILGVISGSCSFIDYVDHKRDGKMRKNDKVFMNRYFKKKLRNYLKKELKRELKEVEYEIHNL